MITLCDGLQSWTPGQMPVPLTMLFTTDVQGCQTLSFLGAWLMASHVPVILSLVHRQFIYRWSVHDYSKVAYDRMQHCTTVTPHHPDSPSVLSIQVYHL